MINKVNHIQQSFNSMNSFGYNSSSNRCICSNNINNNSFSSSSNNSSFYNNSNNNIHRQARDRL